MLSRIQMAMFRLPSLSHHQIERAIFKKKLKMKGKVALRRF